MRSTTPCSSECVRLSDLTDAQPLSMSSRADGAWVIDDRVIRAIAEGGHGSDHPFHLEGVDSTIGARSTILAMIAEHRPRYVLGVDEVCECSFVSPWLQGRPIQDFGLGPNGNRLIAPQERRISWAPSILGKLLADLAKGLTGLHRIGIVHGDPALMNAYVVEGERSWEATWIDLNSVAEATTEARALDIAAFEATCLWPALFDADSFSESEITDLISIARDSAEPLAGYSEALSHERTDHRAGSARSFYLRELARLDPMARDDELGRMRRRVYGLMSPAYFLDQTRSDQNARFFSTALGVERQRHLLLDEERTRLHGIRYQDEIATLSDQVRRIELENARLSTELNENDSVDAAHTESLSHQVAELTHTLNSIYTSRAWRMVSGIRRVLRAPAHVISGLGRLWARPGSSRPVISGRTDASQQDVTVEYPFQVSVIMPIYNKGPILRSSVESVIGQTLGSVEIVIWDDGSADSATLESIAEVAKLPGVTVFTADNQGVVGARNSAIRFARGKYICCLDPDDHIEPTYLEKAVAILESQPEYSITYPWVHSVGDVDEYWETADLDPRAILKANHVPVCAVFRREVFFETGGFSHRMARGYEDWEYWAHAAELGFRGKAIPEYLFNYRFSSNQTLSRDAQARESKQDLIDTIANLHPHLAKRGVPLDRKVVSKVRPIGDELGKRNLPSGRGRPVVLTLPWFTLGGADRVVASLVRRWTAQDRTVVIFTTVELGEGMADRRNQLSEITPFVYSLPDLAPSHLWYGFVAATIAALPTPTVMNVGSPWFFANVARLRRDFPAVWIADQQFNTVGHLEENRDVADHIDLTIAAYDRLAQDLALDGRGSLVESVYVGIDEVTRPDPADIAKFRLDVGLGKDELFVVYVGRLADEKRPEWAIRLSRQLEGDAARVVIIGDGPLRDKVAEAVSSDDRLIWLPTLDSVDVAIAAADLVVLPSKDEGIPLVALEALAFGTPLLATRVGGLPDLEQEAGVTLTGRDDFDAFVKAARKKLSSDPGAIHLPERFSSEAMLNEYDRLLSGD